MKNKSKLEETKVRNLYYLLAYAFDDEKIYFEDNKKFGTEKMSNIYDLFSVVLFIRLKELLKQGMYNEYVEYNEELPYIKGRIDILNTVRMQSLKTKNKVICDFEEYSSNNIINKIIKTTIRYLLNCDILKENRIRLRKIYHVFENVEIYNDARQINWNEIRFNKLNNQYKVIIKMCEYILNTLIVNKEKEDDEFSKIGDKQEYHKLFEKFVRNYLRKYFLEYRRCTVNSFDIKSKKMTWDIDEGEKGAKYIPKMYTDITISNRLRPERIKIIDTKFYSHILTNKGMNGSEALRINKDNWYQLFAYVMNERWHLEKTIKKDGNNKNISISGMLLYASTGEDFRNFEAKVHGNNMGVHVIDFTQEFGDPKNAKEDTIARQMNELAEKIYEELR